MVTVDGLQYETEVKPIDSTYGVSGVYVTLYPVGRDREYGEYYALERTSDGWQCMGGGKIRVTGSAPYGWILSTTSLSNIAFLAGIVEESIPSV